MLKSGILSKKKEIINSIGQKVTDLIQSTFKFPKTLIRSSMARVGEFEKMRPDLISNRLYGTQDGWDLLLKFNAISNPFSINDGDVLYILNYSDLKALNRSPLTIPERTGKSESPFEPIIKGSSKDQNRVKNLKDKFKNRDNYMASNTNTPQLPPNLNGSGIPSIQSDNGDLVLGQGNTSSSPVNTTDSLSRSRLKSALLKNKLFI